MIKQNLLRQHLLFELKSRKNINESDINDVFKSIYSTIISNIKKSPENASGWITDSVIIIIIIIIVISKYYFLAGSSYIKLLKELNHP